MNLSNLKAIEAEAADPTTDPKRLAEIARLSATEPEHRKALVRPLSQLARRNPNLPAGQLDDYLSDGDLDAWANPAVDLLLLSGEVSPESLEVGAFNALAAWKAAPRPELLEGLRDRLVGAIDRRWATAESPDLIDLLHEPLRADDLGKRAHRQIVGLTLLAVRSVLPYAGEVREPMEKSVAWLERWSQPGSRLGLAALRPKEAQAEALAREQPRVVKPLVGAYHYASGAYVLSGPAGVIQHARQALKEHGLPPAQLAAEEKRIADAIRVQVPHHPLRHLLANHPR